jgi:hypothetical protein
MNLLVTVDAAPLDESVAAVGQSRGVVDGRRMSSADVAPLTKHRHLRHQHPVVDRAVRVVTRAAGFPAGGVIPQERTALLGMAREAGFVDVVAHLQQLHVRGAVRVVAARAGHLSFANRHVHGALRLLHLHLVAGAAEGELVHRFQLRLLGDRRVHGVARDAADVARVVRAARPQRVIALVVAGHATALASRAVIFGNFLMCPSHRHPREPCRAMARLAAVLRRGRPRVAAMPCLVPLRD